MLFLLGRCTVQKTYVQQSDHSSSTSYMFAVQFFSLNVVTAKRHYRYRGITAVPITVSSTSTHLISALRGGGGRKRCNNRHKRAFHYTSFLISESCFPFSRFFNYRRNENIKNIKSVSFQQNESAYTNTAP